MEAFILNSAKSTPALQAMVDHHFESAFHYWDGVYFANDVTSVIYQNRQQAVLRMIDGLHLVPGTRVLEIGCGAGHLAAELARRGHRVDAIDRADAMIKTAQDRALKEGLGNRLTIGLGDVNKLDADSGTYDLVVAVGVLPWMSSLDAPLREMARVTKQGGALLVTVDNRWALHRFLEPRINPLVMPFKRRVVKILVLAGFVPSKAEARTCSVRETGRALLRAGLKKKSEFTLGFGPFTVWKRAVVSDAHGIRIHERLQGLANAGRRGIRNMGAHYIVLAAKEG